MDLGFFYENRLEAEFGTPSFALPGRALHVPARNKCVAPSAAMDDLLREDEILRNGPQITAGMTPKECIARKHEIVKNFYKQLGEERDEGVREYRVSGPEKCGGCPTWRHVTSPSNPGEVKILKCKTPEIDASNHASSGIIRHHVYCHFPTGKARPIAGHVSFHLSL